MKNLPRQILIFSLLVMTGHFAAAETVYLTDGTLSAERQGLQVPKRFMTMEDVEQQFGVPISKTISVGNPPISKWRYDRYTVYFESGKVLHTVANLP